MDHISSFGSRKTVARYLRDEQGQAITEYILIVGLIVLPIAIAFNTLRNPLRGYLDRIAKLFAGPGI